MKLTAIVFSQNDLLARSLISLSSKSSQIQILGVVGSVQECREATRQDLPDIIFLDADISLADPLVFSQNIVYLPQIVCILSVQQDNQTFLDTLSYILKEEVYLELTYPITPVKFYQVIDRVLNRQFPSPASPNDAPKVTGYKNDIFVRHENGYTRVLLEEIFYFENVGEYVSIKTSKGNFIILATMKSLERKLDKNIFIKIHRSYIINMKHITNINDTHLTVISKIIPISRAHRQYLLSAINIL